MLTQVNTSAGLSEVRADRMLFITCVPTSNQPVSTLSTGTGQQTPSSPSPVVDARMLGQAGALSAACCPLSCCAQGAACLLAQGILSIQHWGQPAQGSRWDLAGGREEEQAA